MISQESIPIKAFLLEVGIDPQGSLVDRIVSLKRKLEIALPLTNFSWLQLRPAILTEIACREMKITFFREKLLSGVTVQAGPLIKGRDKKMEELTTEFCRLLAMCRNTLRIKISVSSTLTALSERYSPALVERATGIWQEYQAHHNQLPLLARVDTDQPVYICAAISIAAKEQQVILQHYLSLF
jgi:hypothetical protein